MGKKVLHITNTLLGDSTDFMGRGVLHIMLRSGAPQSYGEKGPANPVSQGLNSVVGSRGVRAYHPLLRSISEGGGRGFTLGLNKAKEPWTSPLRWCPRTVAKRWLKVKVKLPKKPTFHHAVCVRGKSLKGIDRTFQMRGESRLI